MFSHESMENLLDNLESELTEMVELDTPKNLQKDDDKKSSVVQELKTSPEKLKKKPTPPPVPARRNISKSPLTPQPPTPASRRINTLDKIEKNNENEIIQLQSLNSENESFSSESKKISQSSSKHNTVISINEKKKMKKEPTSNIRVFHEAEKMPDDINETFFVIKHGKWADESSKVSKDTETLTKDEEKDLKESDNELSQKSDKIPALDKKISKGQEKKKRNLNKKRDSLTTSITTSFTSSSSESLSEEIPQPQKKTKNRKSKDVGQKKPKKRTDDQTLTSNTEESRKEMKRMDITSSDKAVGKLIIMKIIFLKRKTRIFL